MTTPHDSPEQEEASAGATLTRGPELVVGLIIMGLSLIHISEPTRPY